MTGLLLKIRQAGDPILRAKAATVGSNDLASNRVQRLIDDMVATMRDAPGVGLAAPQVGEPLQLAVLEDSEELIQKLSQRNREARERSPVPLTILVNPRIVSNPGTEHVTHFEGCLSLAGLTAAVPRERLVRVEALDRAGRPFELEARGWFARIVQHEVDHLAGVLYVDRMVPRSLCNEDVLRRHFDPGEVDRVLARMSPGIAPSRPHGMGVEEIADS